MSIQSVSSVGDMMITGKHCRPANSVLLPSSDGFTRSPVLVPWRQIEGQARECEENVKTETSQGGSRREREGKEGREEERKYGRRGKGSRQRRKRKQMRR